MTKTKKFRKVTETEINKSSKKKLNKQHKPKYKLTVNDNLNEDY